MKWQTLTEKEIFQYGKGDRQGQPSLTITAEKVVSFLENPCPQGEEVNSPASQASSCVQGTEEILIDRYSLEEYIPALYFSIAILLLQICSNMCITNEMVFIFYLYLL